MPPHRRPGAAPRGRPEAAGRPLLFRRGRNAITVLTGQHADEELWAGQDHIMEGVVAPDRPGREGISLRVVGCEAACAAGGQADGDHLPPCVFCLAGGTWDLSGARAAQPADDDPLPVLLLEDMDFALGVGRRFDPALIVYTADRLIEEPGDEAERIVSRLGMAL